MQRSHIGELCTTPEAYKKPDIRATTKRNMARAIVEHDNSIEKIGTHLLDADYF